MYLLLLYNEPTEFFSEKSKNNKKHLNNFWFRIENNFSADVLINICYTVYNIYLPFSKVILIMHQLANITNSNYIYTHIAQFI